MAVDQVARSLALDAQGMAAKAIITEEHSASGESGAAASFDGAVAGSELKNVKAQIVAVQAGSGDPSPDNVRAISGFARANVYHSGADTSAPTVYAVAFPSEAGTVYGGVLDLSAGKLTVTHASTTVGDLQNASNWGKFEWNGRWFFHHQANPLMKASGVPLCSHYKSAGNYQNMPDKSCGYIYINSICVRDEAYPGTAEGLANFVSDMADAQFVYELATPIVYNVDPVTLNALAGVNNVWADTGDVSLVYDAPAVDSLVKAIKIGDALVYPVQGIADITDAVEALIAGS